MRLKLGTKIELQRDWSDLSDLSDFVFHVISAIKKTRDRQRTDHGPTDGRTDQRTEPHLEMR